MIADFDLEVLVIVGGGAAAGCFCTWLLFNSNKRCCWLFAGLENYRPTKTQPTNNKRDEEKQQQQQNHRNTI